jgi:hypothetical protein
LALVLEHLLDLFRRQKASLQRHSAYWCGDGFLAFQRIEQLLGSDSAFFEQILAKES